MTVFLVELWSDTKFVGYLNEREEWMVRSRKVAARFQSKDHADEAIRKLRKAPALQYVSRPHSFGE